MLYYNQIQLCAAKKKRWLYAKKKRENPEKVNRQGTPSSTLNNDIIPKKMSPLPAVGSFGGVIFSGVVWGIPELLIVSFVVLLPANLVYYGGPLFGMITEFILAYKKQEYNQSISKLEENEQNRELLKMKYDHEYRMKQLEYDSKNKEIRGTDNISSPAADVAEETHDRYFS